MQPDVFRPRAHDALVYPLHCHMAELAYNGEILDTPSHSMFLTIKDPDTKYDPRTLYNNDVGRTLWNYQPRKWDAKATKQYHANYDRASGLIGASDAEVHYKIELDHRLKRDPRFFRYRNTDSFNFRKCYRLVAELEDRLKRLKKEEYFETWLRCFMARTPLDPQLYLFADHMSQDEGEQQALREILDKIYRSDIDA